MNSENEDPVSEVFFTPADWAQIQSSVQNSENWSRIENWWMLDMFGEPGSAKRKAYELKEALGTQSKTIQSLHERKAIRHNYNSALMRILKAFQENDAEFFQMVADGLKQLREKEETAIKTPLHCLLLTYTFMTSPGQSSTEDPPIPTKAEIIAQTKRQWAICRLTGQINPAFITTYDQIQPELEADKLEADIAREIRGLPNQDWTQHFKTLGLKLPHAKPGPKTRVKSPDQESTMRVYFAQSGNQLKIGAAYNPTKRIIYLRVARPGIKLLGHIPGGHVVEKQLHRRFSSERIHGEWFRFTPDLKRSVSEILSANNS